MRNWSRLEGMIAFCVAIALVGCQAPSGRSGTTLVTPGERILEALQKGRVVDSGGPVPLKPRTQLVAITSVRCIEISINGIKLAVPENLERMSVGRGEGGSPFLLSGNGFVLDFSFGGGNRYEDFFKLPDMETETQILVDAGLEPKNAREMLVEARSWLIKLPAEVLLKKILSVDEGSLKQVSTFKQGVLPLLLLSNRIVNGRPLGPATFWRDGKNTIYMWEIRPTAGGKPMRFFRLFAFDDWGISLWECVAGVSEAAYGKADPSDFVAGLLCSSKRAE